MRVCVVADTNLAGSIPLTLLERGIESIHVRSATQSKMEPGSSVSGYKSTWDTDGPEASDLASLASMLRREQVTHVVEATPSGARLARDLRWRLGLIEPGPIGTPYGLSQPDLLRLASEHGVGIPRATLVRKAGEAMAWARRMSFMEVVVKPLGGSEVASPRICGTTSSLEKACTQALEESPDGVNRLVVEERLRGREFHLDTVSRSGQHRIAAIWECQSKASRCGEVVLHQSVLVDPATTEAQLAMECTLQLLDALGVHSAPSQVKVVLRHNGQMVLAGFRCGLSGRSLPKIDRRVTGTSQVEAWAHLLAGGEIGGTPARFHATDLRVTKVHLISHETGTARDWPTELVELETCQGVLVDRHVGSQVEPTTSSRNSPGVAYLVDADGAKIAADLRRLRAAERDGIYTDN